MKMSETLKWQTTLACFRNYTYKAEFLPYIVNTARALRGCRESDVLEAVAKNPATCDNVGHYLSRIVRVLRSKEAAFDL